MTHSVSNPSGRGVGRQLLEAIFHWVPHVEQIHLLTRPQNKQAVEIYLHWGFERSDYTRATYDPNTFIGFTLQGANLRAFRSRNQS